MTDRITIGGRTFRAPDATSFAQDAYLGEVLATLGEELVQAARATEGDPLLQELRSLLSAGRVIPFLAGRLREERNGELVKWSRPGAAELEGLLGDVEDTATKQQLALFAAEDLGRFFGSGLGGRQTTPTSSASPAADPSPDAPTTTSPATDAGVPSSTGSAAPIPKL